MIFGNAKNDNCGGTEQLCETTLTVQSIGEEAIEIGVSASNVGRSTKFTKRVFLIERVGVSPANGSSTPLHPSTLIDEHSIRE